MLVISVLIVVIVNFLFSIMYYSNMMDGESVTSYECGFDSNSLTRVGFSYRFFLISILFLIFDVEIALMLPIPFMLVGEVGLWIVLLFMVVLLVGLLYEYYCGVLNWMDNYMSKA